MLLRKPSGARAGLLLSALILTAYYVWRRPAEAPPAKEPSGPTIRLVHENGEEAFAVSGLGPATSASVAATELPRAAGVSLLAVTANDSPEPLLGTYSIQQGTLRFRPRWPLVPGVRYTAKLYAERQSGGPTVITTFTVPKPPLPPPAKVAAVYPSADRLPENLLRIYLHFTGPMRRGDVYDFIRVLGPDGKPIETPFVTLGEELWNDDGTRLTLFLDPGRQKHDLLPRQQAGPVLEAGKNYTLVIAADWPDVHGRPLGQEFRKMFQAIAPETRPIQPGDWKINAPSAGGREPLVVTFDRSLDDALLRRVVTVADAAGKTIEGEIKPTDAETRWQFVPKQPWTAGEYVLMVEKILEDVSGNRVGRAFEVDEDRTEAGPVAAVRRMFTVTAK
jgi:hypothetical protein